MTSFMTRFGVNCSCFKSVLVTGSKCPTRWRKNQTSQSNNKITYLMLSNFSFTRVVLKNFKLMAQFVQRFLLVVTFARKFQIEKQPIRDTTRISVELRLQHGIFGVESHSMRKKTSVTWAYKNTEIHTMTWHMVEKYQRFL